MSLKKTRILRKGTHHEVPTTARRLRKVSDIRRYSKGDQMGDRPLEKDLQGKILKDLRSLYPRCSCFKIMKSSDYGVPDVFFTTQLTGAIFIECKREGEVPSPNQKKMIADLNRNGTKAFVCDSWGRWMEIKNILKLHVIHNSIL